MKPKLRITLLDKDLISVSDRLVDQYTEFLNGPKDKHDGPIRIETTLENSDDVEALTKYLEQLSGDLPIKESIVRSIKSAEATKDSIRDLIGELDTKCKDQVKLIEYLRGREYRFVTAQFLEDFEIPIKIKDKHKDRYHFMIRLLKEAKDPINNKYDPQLIIGIDVIKKKRPKVVIYTYGKFNQLMKKVWPKKIKVNFSKVNLRKFPHYMTLEERQNWRREHYKLEKNKDLKPSKFYLRWKDPIDKENKAK